VRAVRGNAHRRVDEPGAFVRAAVVSAHAGNLWMYVVGPLIGATLAVLISAGLHPHHDREEREAAEGEAGA
jgi:hypothetical protein